MQIGTTVPAPTIPSCPVREPSLGSDQPCLSTTLGWVSCLNSNQKFRRTVELRGSFAHRDKQNTDSPWELEENKGQRVSESYAHDCTHYRTNDGDLWNLKTQRHQLEKRAWCPGFRRGGRLITGRLVTFCALWNEQGLPSFLLSLVSWKLGSLLTTGDHHTSKKFPVHILANWKKQKQNVFETVFLSM